MYDPFILVMIFLISVVLLGILWLIFAKIIAGYEQAKLSSQQVTDIDYELQLILYSNCEFDGYDGYNFAEVIGLNVRDEDSLNVLECIHQNGALQLTAEVNNRVARFYVMHEDKRMFESYSDPSGFLSSTWTSIKESLEGIYYKVRSIINDAGRYLGVIDTTNPDFEYSIFKKTENLVDRAVITIPVYPSGTAKAYLETWDK